MATTRSKIVVFTGARVMSADGKHLGTVKDARTDRFRVNARWAPDYWLGLESVETSDQQIVQLAVTRDALNQAKIHLDITGPGLN